MCFQRLFGKQNKVLCGGGGSKRIGHAKLSKHCQNCDFLALQENKLLEGRRTKIEAMLSAVKMIPDVELPDKSQILIFVNRLETVQHVVDSVKAAGIEASGIHGNVDQRLRDRMLREFVNGDVRILVSTNLLGRGIDIPDIAWVINYDMPLHLTEYIHRIGRTGRAGRKGVALTLLDELDLRHSRSIHDVLVATGGQTIPDWLVKES